MPCVKVWLPVHELVIQLLSPHTASNIPDISALVKDFKPHVQHFGVDSLGLSLELGPLSQQLGTAAPFVANMGHAVVLAPRGFAQPSLQTSVPCLCKLHGKLERMDCAAASVTAPPLAVRRLEECLHRVRAG